MRASDSPEAIKGLVACARMEGNEMSDATNVTPKALAAVCDTSAKRMRSFIRSMDEKGTPIMNANGDAIVPVGSGNRYAFSRVDALAIVAAFRARPMTADHRSPAIVKADVQAWLDGDDAIDDDDAIDGDDEGDDA